MRDSKAESVTKLLEEFFAFVGWPINLRSDGGPCFVANHFQRFCVTNGIRHCKSAPGHHQSNGGAECGVREIKALMKTTNKTGIEQAKPGLRSAIIRLCLGSDFVVLVLGRLGVSDWSMKTMLIYILFNSIQNSWLNIHVIRAWVATVEW